MGLLQDRGFYPKNTPDANARIARKRLFLPGFSLDRTAIIGYLLRGISTTRKKRVSDRLLPLKIGGFWLLRLCGKGTTAEVFEAWDTQQRRRVAVKILTGRPQDSPDEQLAEVRAAASIQHPNVVRLFSVGSCEYGQYIVMELMDGPRLEEGIRQERAMNERTALRVIRDASLGLHAAAQHGRVHGDVKPQNILLNDRGVAKVGDFGLAERAVRSQGSKVWGTPLYIAPERLKKRPADVRSDIFSLGATMYHLLTARPPSNEDLMDDLLRGRLKSPPPDPRETNVMLAEETARLVKAMMAINPEDRPDTHERVAETCQIISRGLRAPLPAADGSGLNETR